MASISNDHCFVVKNQERISGVLSCFDRVIFRGYLPLSYAKGMEGFFYQQKVPLKQRLCSPGSRTRQGTCQGAS
jgi:hypothetical protein